MTSGGFAAARRSAALRMLSPATEYSSTTHNRSIRSSNKNERHIMPYQTVPLQYMGSVRPDHRRVAATNSISVSRIADIFIIIRGSWPFCNA